MPLLFGSVYTSEHYFWKGSELNKIIIEISDEHLQNFHKKQYPKSHHPSHLSLLKCKYSMHQWILMTETCPFHVLVFASLGLEDEFRRLPKVGTTWPGVVRVLSFICGVFAGSIELLNIIFSSSGFSCVCIFHILFKTIFHLMWFRVFTDLNVLLLLLCASSERNYKFSV